VFTTAYRPTTNGQVERWNATLVDAIAQLGMEKEWDRNLGLACTAYNSSVHATTGYAPIELASTRNPCPSVWARQPDLLAKTRDSKLHFRHQLLARAAKLCKSAWETMDTRLQRYKKIYDYHVRRRHGDLELGDSVLVRTHVIEPSRSPKLSFPVAGPYTVVKIEGPNVDIRTREEVRRVHLDRVIRCPMDLPSGVEWAPQSAKSALSQPRPPTEADDQFVIERLISHARASDDTC
jgi:hypothetical protein